ncbi:MAG: tRNA preQ1(34) S-adenosylmethionine ribosyltransferase-isomerase QueA [bacterium]
MKLHELDYHLPSALIAYEALKKRSQARLLILNKKDGGLEHKTFKDIIDHLYPGDVLVLNDTKVFPARLKGIDLLNYSKVEILLLEGLASSNIWKALVKPKKRLKIGRVFNFKDKIFAHVLDIIDNVAVLELNYQGELFELLDQIGEMPLPPYIKRKEKKSDKTDYQTIYAKENGSIAAPTAGLHFTKALLKEIRKKGISIVYLTLHVGWGSFKPIKCEEIKDHEMWSEFYQISQEEAEIINQCQGRVIAVGTTTTRALESAYSEKEKKVLSGERTTNIFIYPDYKFKVVDALITNFHLPKSTLLALVYAFATKKKAQNAYQEAIGKEYKFYSFGDAMYIY